MNPKSLHPLAASFLTNQFKNITSCPDNNFDSSSQPITNGSPSQKFPSEAHSDSLKPYKNRRTASMKLAFIVDNYGDRSKKPPFFQNMSKNPSSAASISPRDREIKSTRASEVIHVAFPSKTRHPKEHKKPKDGSRLTKKGSNKDIFDRENIIRQKKLSLTGQLYETEHIEKAIEPLAMSYANCEAADAKKILDASDMNNKETLRLRKLRKSQKSHGSGAARHNLSQQFPPALMACNFSHSPDNSIFNGSSTTKTSKRKIEAATQSESNLHAFGSSKSSFFNTISHEKVTSKKSKSGERGRTKNLSIGEAITRDLQQKAYLNCQPSVAGGHQGHRKNGSTGGLRASMAKKALCRPESFYNMNIPSNSGAPNGPKTHLAVDKSRSQDTKGSQRTGPTERSQSKTKKDLDLEQLNVLKGSFGSVINSYGAQVVDTQANQKLLIKIKQDYDAMIEGLMSANQRMQRKLDLAPSSKEEDKGGESQLLLKDNAVLRQEVSDLELEVKRLNDVVKDLRGQSKGSPCKSLTTTEKRCPSDLHDSPPVTKHGKDVRNQEHEISQLKEIIMNQQKSLMAMNRKEDKWKRLIFALEREGVDVKRIYDEQVRGKFDHLAREETIPTLHKARRSELKSKEPVVEEEELMSITPKEEEPHELSGIELGLDSNNNVQDKNGAENKSTTDSIPPTMVENVNSHDKLNPKLKSKLKLDFRALKKDESKGDKNGFHEEFMLNYDKFSLSWREASKLQKN